ncbi:hypothetical protein [Methanobrevibacter sp.]
MKQVDNHHKFWIHRVDLDVVSQINNSKCIGAQKRRSTAIRDIHSGDRIILLSKINNSISFFGYTQVDRVYKDQDNLFEYYFSKNKLKLKGIKYFLKPIPTINMVEKLDFIKKKNKSATYFRSEYKEISKEDFTRIFKQTTLIKSFPPYLEEIRMNYKEFMLATIRAIYNFVKNVEKRNQIEIKTFLNLLKKFLAEYDINKNINEIQEFYSRHAIELDFKHIPSRDPDKFVPLYLANGEKKNFAYINLE